MYSLQSELFKKQQEVTSRKASSSSSDVIRKQHKLKTGGTDSKPPEYKKNAGVEERDARDISQTPETEDKSKMVRSVLEAKSRLYEKMASGDILPYQQSCSEFLVDFEKKAIGERIKRKNVEMKPQMGVNIARELAAEMEKADDEMVEYVDGLGRTRVCRRHELDEMRSIDKKLGIENSEKTLLSDDMRREMEREKWEEEALGDANNPIHYETLRAGEVRELGVGYYSFSTNQETREKQMKMLRKMRQETEKEKKSLKESERKKRTALGSRLEKVRLGRIKKLKKQGKEIPASLLNPIELPQIDDYKSEAIDKMDDVTVEVTKRNDQDRPIREWDKDKEWTPAQLPKAPKSWRDPRDDRLDEFAPPSVYHEGIKTGEIVREPSPCETVDSTETARNHEMLENPDELISRIRNNLTGDSKTTPDEPQECDNVQTESEVSSAGLNQESANYVPRPDNPIAIKVKALPKKKLVLENTVFKED